jgi:hypothetical protein
MCVSQQGANKTALYVEDLRMRLTPPTNTAFVLAVLIFLVGLLGHHIPQVAALIPFSGNYYIPVIAFVILAIGNLVEGV